MEVYNSEPLRSSLSAAGFPRAEGHSNPELHWLCLIAKKK